VGSYGAAVVAPYNRPSLQRRRLWPLWVTVAALAALLAAGGVVAVYFATKPSVSDSQQWAAEFKARDPYGSEACAWLGSWMTGVISRDDGWTRMREAMRQATTREIQDAVDQRALHEACVAQGAPMIPYQDGPG
jgi:hypothetical protein